MRGKRGPTPESVGTAGKEEGADGFTSGAENTNIRRPTLVEEGAKAAAKRGAGRGASKSAQEGADGDGTASRSRRSSKRAQTGADGAGDGSGAPEADGKGGAVGDDAEGGSGAGSGEEAEDERIVVEGSPTTGGGAKKGGRGGASKRAQQPDLIADMRIEELHSAALGYVADRDARIAAGQEEKKSKDLLLALMKKHEKETYSADGVTVRIVHEKENLKVEVNKGGDDE